MAGQQAVQRSANAEAISHLTTALELLKTLPDTPERTQQELTLQLALSAPLFATKGGAAPEVAHVYTRARELSQQLGKTLQFLPVRGLWNFYLIQGELQTACELGEQVLVLAQEVQDPTLLPEAYRARGTTLFLLGEFVLAREHLEQSMALYDPQAHRSLVSLYGFDPGVFGLSWTALVLWFLGYPDQALQKSREALTLARELSHSYSLAAALIYTAMLHQLRQEEQATQERLAASIALSTEQGFALWMAFGPILQGWTLAERGQGEEGIAQIRQSLTAYRATGAEIIRPYHLSLLAELCGEVGQAGEGLTVLSEALAVVDKTRERFYEAELYRLKGELTLQQFKVQGSKFKVEEVETYFHKAIDIAQKQQAKSLELRAVMSLTRLWQGQGKTAEAHRMLSEIYNWFTEGFDTKNLQDAKALLDELQ